MDGTPEVKKIQPAPNQDWGGPNDCFTPSRHLCVHVGLQVLVVQCDARPRVLVRMRAREGMAVAKAKGRLRGKKPKLSVSPEKHLVSLYLGGEHTTAEIAKLFGVAWSTVYRAMQLLISQDDLPELPLRRTLPEVGLAGSVSDQRGPSPHILLETMR